MGSGAVVGLAGSVDEAPGVAVTVVVDVWVGLMVGVIVGDVVTVGDWVAGIGVAVMTGLGVGVYVRSGVALGLGVAVRVGTSVGVAVRVDVAETKGTRVGDTNCVLVGEGVGEGAASSELSCQRTTRLNRPMQYMHRTVRNRRATARHSAFCR